MPVEQTLFAMEQRVGKASVLGAERDALYRRYADKLFINPELTRALVSYQANKRQPFYRWLKYKEAFSVDLIRYLLRRFSPGGNGSHRLLDPFAGAGTTLTVGAQAGWNATGIELLPVGVAAARARIKGNIVSIRSFRHHLKRLQEFSVKSGGTQGWTFPHLRITQKAFSRQTEKAISGYHDFLDGIRNPDLRDLFWFACLSILEEVSFTRKDGQYLRWDSRSGRGLRSSFNKGFIPDFQSAIVHKLEVMLDDIKHCDKEIIAREIKIIEGSCLAELPKLSDASFDMVITSPPYCNRYDYTRTYALELAFMGFDEDDIKSHRQSLLSATVENKTKRHQLQREYERRDQEDRYRSAVEVFSSQRALHEVLGILYEAKKKGDLNNSNIPNLVENYFFEMNLVVSEISRVLAPGGRVIMVNDNVQFHGEQIPVDLILSDLASSQGLSVDCIWVLSRGKGNSSQQMGVHGRRELRKCVYVWKKET